MTALDSALGLAPILKVIIGLVLIFVAAKIVGFVIKVVGGAFVLYGAYLYMLSSTVNLEVIFPVAVGVALIAVGKSMAETTIKIVGVLVALWGVMGLGII